MLRFRRFALLLSTVAVLAGSAALPDHRDWPTRSVTVIVPFGAGGNTDMMARLGAQHLTAKFGQTFVIENRPSAGGALGSGQVSAAAPDGYTLMFSAASTVVLTPQLQKLNFDPGKQLVPITNMGTGTQMIAIKRELPVKNLPEFIAYAKANPGKLNFTVAGTQNISHLAPVRAVRPRRDRFGDGAAEERAAGHHRSGIRPGGPLFRQLFVAPAAHQQQQDQTDRGGHAGAHSRCAGYPDGGRDHPGFPVFIMERISRAGSDAGAVVSALRNEITAFAKSAAVSERLTKLGIVPGGLSLEQSQAAFTKERDAYTAAIKAAGIEPPQ